MIEVRIAADPADRDACRALRRAVFIEEQGVSEADEFDGLDDACTHLLALAGDRPIGTARLRLLGDGVAKAQRVAVVAEWRGQGVGAALMAALEVEARRQGAREVRLGAQLTALAFYERLGYAPFGEVFDDAGIPHRMMRKALV